ncbi:MAG TPA: hypothetical protein VE282_04090 [Gemmatimonadales bacterium]|nr:hypothetical protein [Gemmatimonadales bacterium]
MVVLCLPPSAAAQLPPVGVPSGMVRVELEGSLETFDRRFRAGNLESYAADLFSNPLGSERIPGLAESEARIGRVTGDAGYRLNLGTLAADAHADVGLGWLGLSLGLPNNITLFGRIPLVRSRVQTALNLDPTSANAGLNPGESDQLVFLSNMDAALATLSAKLAAGDYDTNPSQRALAEATLADATALRADLFSLLADPSTASPVLPTTSSTAGTAMTARVTALQATLANDLSVPGFTLVPSLPETPLTEAELDQALSDPFGPIAVQLGESRLMFRGDAEVGASLTLVDRWDRGARRGGSRAAISGLVRFPTGRRESPDRPLDIGTGDGQTDIQVDAVADIGSGPFGARISGTYVMQRPSHILTRVASPDQPFAGLDRLTRVRRDPGEIVALRAYPFYRLARTLALQAGVEHWSRGSDSYTYASPEDERPGIDPNVLAEDSETNATLLSVGITYSNPGRLRPGGTGLPVDATWSYERLLRASGRVPNSHAVRARFRVYFGVW